MAINIQKSSVLYGTSYPAKDSMAISIQKSSLLYGLELCFQHFFPKSRFFIVNIKQATNILTTEASEKPLFFCSKKGGNIYELFNKWVFSLVFLFCVLPAQAVKIYFPDEELATESVLPLVNKPKMVVNRNVPFKRSIEFSLGSGFGLTEPFYFPIYPQGQLGFYINNVHSFHILGSYYFPRLSNTFNDVKNEGIKIPETDEKIHPDPLKVPYPQYSMSLNYQYSPFYGKISLAKNFVLNLSIYSFFGVGVLVSNKNKFFPLGRLGIGQSLYFFKSSSLTLGLKGDLALTADKGSKVGQWDLGEKDSDVATPPANPSPWPNIHIVANIGLLILLSL